MAAWMRSCVSPEIGRFPERAYDTVLRDTPATRATSPMVATVLLSPAAASFDMFADYAARGRAFKDAVADLVASRARSRP